MHKRSFSAALLLFAAAAGPVGGDAAAALPITDGSGAAALAQAYTAGAALGDLRQRSVALDRIGGAHVRFDQYHAGLPVFEGQVIVHVDLDDATVTGTTDARREVGPVATTPRVSAVAAARTARREARLRGIEDVQAELMILVSADEVAHLAWRVRFIGPGTHAGPVDWISFVDALTGEILLAYDNLHTKRTNPPIPDPGIAAIGTAHTLYAGTVAFATELYSDGSFGMRDPTRGGNYTTDMNDGRVGNGELFTDLDNVWGDSTTADRATVGSDAHFGATMTWDYYLSTYGRRGINDDGKGTLSRVHYGRNYVNAFYSDACLCVTYGDGDGELADPLVAFDITAHELTHGVTAATADLTYLGESGGLNESMSDIFATSVEFYAAARSSTVPDYWLGEDVWTPEVPGDALRYMDHPRLDGRSIDHYSQYTTGMDVHYSSGLANNVFYLLSEGGSNDTSGMSVTPIGREEAERVFYRALIAYMTPGTDFADAKDATVQAATDLYGSDTAALVGRAWEACGVF